MDLRVDLPYETRDAGNFTWIVFRPIFFCYEKQGMSITVLDCLMQKLPILQKHGITHIICIRQNIEANFIKPNFQQLFRYLVLDIADNPVENIIRFFPMTKEFIDGSLQTGGKVLVHGNAGISRSAAFVIAYIMETFGVKYRDAFAYVQERRFCINPNAGFVHQLQNTKL
ncbi:hypothetical protein HPG69_012009 [Diceros bicornis minor]|uniref:Serine/threonine/tyrosine-interacting protein n=1 Tax=Diceros bicornis minor TaxID=77932 RepID=A0A7J7EI20_DICBM|nr:hypothetical protein HPG69_012009 [Diceros bicornis minor]